MYDANMIVVAFDIPETRKTARQKFRRQLKRWDFQPVQKSVWQTSQRWPADFESVLAKLHIEDCVKIYKTSNSLMTRSRHKGIGEE